MSYISNKSMQKKMGFAGDIHYGVWYDLWLIIPLNIIMDGVLFTFPEMCIGLGFVLC